MNYSSFTTSCNSVTVPLIQFTFVELARQSDSWITMLGLQGWISRLATWSENCKWYSFVPLGALFCESV